MFFKFNQNNSGGRFIVNDTVCHQLYIEANSKGEALIIAEGLGCYWNGVEDGRDCSCCGDRWNTYADVIDIEKYKEKGYAVGVYDFYPEPEKRWYDLYGDLILIEAPVWKNDFSKQYVGKVAFRNIEEYAQLMADEYGWTTPDARIFYLDGTTKEIFQRNKL